MTAASPARAAVDDPIADAGPDITVAVGETAVLDGRGSLDSREDTSDLLWTWVSKPAGSAAALHNTGAIKPRFVPDLPGTYVLELTLTAGNRTSAPDQVIVSTVNSAPIAKAGADLKADLNVPVTLDGSGSTDSDGDSLTHQWTLVSAPMGSSAALTDPTAVLPGLTPDVDGDYVIELAVFDGTAWSDVDSVVVSTLNAPPVAEAGEDVTTSVGQAVQLDATLSADPDGDELDYSWALIAAPIMTAQDLNSQEDLTPVERSDKRGWYVLQAQVSDGQGNGARDQGDIRSTFIPDVAGAFLLQLTVDDGNGHLSTDTVIVSVGNVAPVAEAGPAQTVVPGDLVQLDGADSTDYNGNRLSYRWALTSTPAGSVATLNDPSAIRPQFAADLPGTYVAQLTVIDEQGQRHIDTVTVSTDNSQSFAEAGPEQAVAEGAPVQLDGTGSVDADGDTLTYQWSILEQPNASHNLLVNETTATPTFTIDHFGTYVFQLAVDDGVNDLALDTVVVTTVDARPIAEAGQERAAVRGETVTLDGSASVDPDGGAIAYRWDLIGAPEGTTATLTDAETANPTLIPDLVGTYVVQLIVNDGDYDSPPATVVITVENQMPLADAGPDAAVYVGDTAFLDGSGSSDPDGDALTYAWVLSATPTGSSATPSGLDTATPSIIPDIRGDYVFDLTVTDSLGASATDSVTVSTLNRAPVAEAGADQTVSAGATVTLDATASLDPDQDTLTYAWTFTEKPQGSSAGFTAPTTAVTQFTADLPGVYVAQVTVHDGDASASDTVAITAVQIGNQPPVFDPVGDVSINLGQTLKLVLSATDPEGETTPTFSATPLPLPANATLDSQSGTFVFQPDASQVGTITLTFLATDSVVESAQTVNITVNGADPDGVTALTGVVLDANAAAEGMYLPVPNVTLSIDGQSGGVLSGEDGTFLLSDLPSGSQTLILDATTVDPDSEFESYISVRHPIALIADVTNELANPLYVAQVATNAVAVVDPSVNTVITDSVTGYRLTILAGSAKNPDGSLYDGEVTLTAVPAGTSGLILPPHVDPCKLVRVGPEDVYFDPPAILRTPDNEGGSTNRLSAGRLAAWAMDPDTGEFRYAQNISARNRTAAVVTESSIYTITPFRPRLSPVPGSVAGHKRVDLFGDGSLRQGLTLPGYSSDGGMRDITLLFNGAAADPRPVIASEADFTLADGRVSGIEHYVEIGGIRMGASQFVDGTGMTHHGEPSVRLALPIDASALPTGFIPFKHVMRATYQCSTVGAERKGVIAINNQEDSAIGGGWTVQGLEKLVVSGASLSRVAGDGSMTQHPHDPAETFSATIANIPVGDPIDITTADFNGDSNLDMAIADNSTGAVLVFAGDGLGGFAQTQSVVISTAQSAGSNPNLNQLEAADFNEDGHADIVAVEQLSGEATILLNDGTGQLVAQTPIKDLGNDLGLTLVDGLVVADFNLDGHADLGLTEYYCFSLFGQCTRGSEAHFLYGDGTGAFPSSRTVTAGERNAQAVTGDFNGDDVPDLAYIADSTRQIIFQITNPSTGTVSARTVDLDNLPALLGIQPLAAGDVNGDGIDDLLVTSALDQVTIIRGDVLQPSLFDTLETAHPLGGIALADLDADGDLDLISADRQGRMFTTVNLGGGQFASASALFSGAPSPFPPGNVLGSLALADINNDGALDILQADVDAHVVQPILGGGSSNSFVSPLGDFADMARDGAGGYTRSLPTGEVYAYNADGLMTGFTDRNGNLTSYAYDAEGRLTGITDSNGQTTTFGYDGQGLLSFIAYPDGRTSAFIHDGDGNLTRVVHAEPATAESYAYNGQGAMTGYTDPAGYATAYSYGPTGGISGIDRPDGSSIALDIAGDLGLGALSSGAGTEANPLPWATGEPATSLVTDPNGNDVILELDAYGNILAATDQNGHTRRFTRDSHGRPIRVVTDHTGELPNGSQPGSVTTEIDWNEANGVDARRDAVGTPLARQTAFTYEPQFNMALTATDAAGDVTSWTYDAEGNPLTVTNGNGETRTNSFDGAGRLLTVTDANGNVTAFSYDALGNLATVTDAIGIVTRYTRDGAGRVTRTVIAEGTADERSADYAYDDLGRLIAVTDANGDTVAYEYDPRGLVTAVTDADGVTTTATYDALGRIETLTDPATGTTTLTRDLNGNVILLTDELGRETRTVYDPANRPLQTIDPLGQVQTFDYDYLGNLTLLRDANGNATSFAYDILNRQIRRTNPLGEAYASLYDGMDRVTQVTDPLGQITSFAYDGAGRLTGYTTPDGTTQFTYDPHGNLTAAQDSDSAFAWTYDARNLPLTAEVLPGGVQLPSLLTDTYNTAAERSGLTADWGQSWVFGQDNLGRPVSLTPPDGAAIGLAYLPTDQLSGITFPSGAGSSAAYLPTSSQLASITHSLPLEGDYTRSYGYDAVGNVNQITDPAGVVRDHGLDDLDRLTEVKQGTTTEERYLEVIERKTATLFEAGTRLGAVLAKTDSEIETAAAGYGLQLGIAFQLVDDALDYRADGE
ncbi:MAG: PKD domain-containing protein, partial [Magnetospiraceae bacterium]